MSSDPQQPASELLGKKWEILLVDDHEIIREGLRSLIDRQPSMRVCGEADSVTSALRAISQHSPDLAVIDLSLVESNGLDLIRQLTTEQVEIKLLVFSHRPAWVMTEKVIEAGAQGYVQKSTNNTDQLIEAIETIMGGDDFRSKDSQSPLDHPLADGVQALTEKEYLVFEGLGMGKEPREIAKELDCATNTVRTYLDRSSKKLGAKSLGELRCAAMSWRLDALL